MVGLVPMLFATYESVRLLQGFVISVRDNQTLIESYKEVRGREESWEEKVEGVFGGGWRIGYLLPVFVNNSLRMNYLS